MSSSKETVGDVGGAVVAIGYAGGGGGGGGGQPERPLRELLLLAGPTIAQMASYTVMQFLDTWMLSRLGTAEPTAAGQASLFAWSFIGFGVGVLFCVNTLVSQS